MGFNAGGYYKSPERIIYVISAITSIVSSAIIAYFYITKSDFFIQVPSQSIVGEPLIANIGIVEMLIPIALVFGALWIWLHFRKR